MPGAILLGTDGDDLLKVVVSGAEGNDTLAAIAEEEGFEQWTARTPAEAVDYALRILEAVRGAV